MTYDNEIGTARSTGATSVSALFDSQADAQNAIDRLVEIGIPTAQIRMVDGGSSNTTAAAPADREKGFWESLSDFFFPDEDRYSYAQGLSRGGYLVTATGLSSTQYETALDILDDEGTVNLQEREESWRAEGWGGYEASPYAAGTGAAIIPEAGTLTTTETTGDRLGAGTDETIPVVEERLRVGKRDTSHGRVRVRAYTVEEPVSESIDLREDRVEIDRRLVDRAAVTDADFRDRTIEAEEHREEAVVSKEARVVEEVGLRKTSDTHRETISDTVRHTEVEIEDDRDENGVSRKDR